MGYDVKLYEIFPTYESSDLLLPALLGFLALLLGRLALHQRQHTLVPQHMLHGAGGTQEMAVTTEHVTNGRDKAHNYAVWENWVEI